MDATGDPTVEARRKITAPIGIRNLAILPMASHFTDCASGLIKVITAAILTKEE
jgi:hypothetical protein